MRISDSHGNWRHSRRTEYRKHSRRTNRRQSASHQPQTYDGEFTVEYCREPIDSDPSTATWDTAALPGIAFYQSLLRNEAQGRYVDVYA